MIIKELSIVFGTAAQNNYLDHLFIDWSKEEFIEGGYSYPTLLESNNNFREVLSKSINDKLFFAGEALSKNNYSSIGGALESSQTAINQIMNVFCK